MTESCDPKRVKRFVSGRWTWPITNNTAPWITGENRLHRGWTKNASVLVSTRTTKFATGPAQTKILRRFVQNEERERNTLVTNVQSTPQRNYLRYDTKKKRKMRLERFKKNHIMKRQIYGSDNNGHGRANARRHQTRSSLTPKTLDKTSIWGVHF